MILHDKHNRQVMLQVKRLILPIENANWHTIRYDSTCYVNFLLLHLNIWVHPWPGICNFGPEIFQIGPDFLLKWPKNVSESFLKIISHLELFPGENMYSRWIW